MNQAKPEIPSVLLVDDGELRQMRSLIQEVGAAVTVEREMALTPANVAGHGVVVTTARTALHGRAPFEGMEPEDRPIWIVFHNQDFRPMRENLRAAGVDFLVNPNVDAETLRLLFLRVVHCGSDRRGTQRVPVGSELNCTIEGERLAVALLDFGTASGRIVAPGRIVPGSELVLELPPGICGSTAVRLAGRVERARVRPGRRGIETVAGVRFDDSYGRHGRALQAIESGRAVGVPVTPLHEDAYRVSVEGASEPVEEAEEETTTETLQTGAIAASESFARETPTAGTGEDAGEESIEALIGDLLEEIDPTSRPLAAGASKERRLLPRGEFQRRIQALQGRALDVMIGRDLSMGGLRIEPREDLSVGDILELAIPGPAREEPLIVRATVVRDGGEHGLGLAFDELPESDRRRLERLTLNLPGVNSLDSWGADADAVLLMRESGRDTQV